MAVSVTATRGLLIKSDANDEHDQPLQRINKLNRPPPQPWRLMSLVILNLPQYPHLWFLIFWLPLPTETKLQVCGRLVIALCPLNCQKKIWWDHSDSLSLSLSLSLSMQYFLLLTLEIFFFNQMTLENCYLIIFIMEASSSRFSFA